MTIAHIQFIFRARDSTKTTCSSPQKALALQTNVNQRVVVRLQLQGIFVCEPQSHPGNLAKYQVNIAESPSK